MYQHPLRQQRASVNRLQAFVVAILIVITPIVVTDYFSAQNELKQARGELQSQLAPGAYYAAN